MKEYPKIDTVFERDTNGTRRLMENVFRNLTVEMLRNIEWVWTEKIDGTNIRIHWDGHRVSFAGRTDSAQIPDELLTYLTNTFGTSEAEELFEQMYGDKEVILFGEGYGRKIQNGGAYIPDGVGFILFDVVIGYNYQEREWIEATAKAFGIPVVPIVGIGTIDEAVAFIKTNPDSVVGNCKMEGVVVRPKYELHDRLGRRIIVKIKWNDMRFLA